MIDTIELPLRHARRAARRREFLAGLRVPDAGGGLVADGSEREMLRALGAANAAAPR